MVREGYGTSGEGNGTTVGHLKVGTGEVLPLLARDPNYSSVPGSDAEPRLSDAGSGNEGPKKAARGRASLHGEVLIANKTLKKKPYKSLGWSLIAAAASGILVACMVAAAVVPFSSIGPAHAVDADTATTFNEHMGVFDDENAVAPVGEGRAASAPDALEPMTRAAFARAVEAKGGKVTKSPKSGSRKSWPTPLVVVPAVFDEWDTPVGAPPEASAVPDWAAPGDESAYAVSELYQRRDEDGAGFVPNRAYETGVFLKFVVDHYDNLPEVTAFVSGDFTKDAGGDANARAALEDVADAVSVSKLGKKTSENADKKAVSRKAFTKDKKDKDADASDVPPAIAQYQPLVVDPETFLQSRSPGELVQMWKEQRWGWEDIMGDSAGAAAAHLSRCWRAVAESFGADLDVKNDDVKKTSKHEGGSKTKTEKHSASRLGASFFFASSSAASRTVAEQGEAKEIPEAASVTAADRDELAKPPVSVSLYPGAHFAVTRDALLRLPKKTWERAYEQLVEKGACVDASSDAPRDEIRDKFDLGVSLEFLSHVVFGGAALDAGAEARCCGAKCVLQDPSCAELGDLRKERDADAYDVASIGGPRFDLDAKRMLSVERVISRYNGWNLKELREERLAAEVAAVGEDEAAITNDDVDSVDDDDVPEDPRLEKAAPGMDVDVDPADVEAALEADDAALEAEDAELEAALDEEDEASELDEDAELGNVAYVTADLGASNQFVPEDWEDARETLHNAEAKWQRLIDAEKTKNKVGTLGGPETEKTEGAAAVVADGAAKPADGSAKPAEPKPANPSTSETEIPAENVDGSAVTDAELKQLLAEYVEQADAQIAEISELREENARLREEADEARGDVVDLGADEASRSLAARASAMDKQTLVAMAKEKIDGEETANAKLKEALAAMEEVHHEERAEYGRRVANVRAAKRDTEAERASAVEATASLQKELDVEKARAEKTRMDAEAALEHDERRVANLHAKLRDAAKLEQEMEEKKNVAADAARRLRQKLAEADRANAAEETDAQSDAESDAEPKPRAKKPIAKVGAAEEGVAALALPPRRRPATAAESQ